MTRRRDFLIWLCVTLFFLFTYTPVMTELSTESAIETTIYIFIHWLWIMSAFFSMGKGLMCLNPRNRW